MNKEIEYYGILNETGIKEFISTEGMEELKKDSLSFTMCIRSAVINGLVFNATLNASDGDAIVKLVERSKSNPSTEPTIGTDKAMKMLFEKLIKAQVSDYGTDRNLVNTRWKAIKESILNPHFKVPQ